MTFLSMNPQNFSIYDTDLWWYAGGRSRFFFRLALRDLPSEILFPDQIRQAQQAFQVKALACAGTLVMIGNCFALIDFETDGALYIILFIIVWNSVCCGFAVLISAVVRDWPKLDRTLPYGPLPPSL